MKKSIATMLFGLLVSASSYAETITVSHQLGKTTLETKPQRVVVIGTGTLDAIDYFGIKPVAVTQATTMPSYLLKYKTKEYASSGSLSEPDFETIYMQKPDVIIIGSRAVKAYKDLSEIAPTIVFAADSTGYWKSTQQQWRMLGNIFEIQDKVEAKIASVDAEFNAIAEHNKANNVAALTVMSAGGNITTFGAQSRFSSIYKDFGFKEAVEGIKESRHGDLVSYEFIRDVNPSNLLIIDKDKLINKDKSRTREEFANPLVKATDAYKNDSLTYLDINAWYLAISGVTATDQMIADVKQSIHL
ncbi:siderophore ABC transporter substrate-binding protein [Aliivibrio fischeri]|uniref:siderophore ABC transporter substrate-binding protein n=1 Tax=Aliivibrio fischeri TaxID=668 RepID=UPI0012DA7E5D|nr:siderophore ABC transporter substrate-binding protein [Aliivibrio fischeri]MUJ27579.1 ABC transporter substrate-binding protein [Aliivibrio fischeri]MUK69106.1 ABC transporter substrate-binding protein [Aliivibrio fischeri]MUK71859.1 ABC transporter substrate-binding protein [Aliivibrio fischeri]